VRQLEKQLGKLVRKAVVKLLDDPEAVIKIGNKDLEAPWACRCSATNRYQSGTGVITGLAWTSMGGATLPIEATRIHTLNRGFKLTGQLGEVMKESAEIAYSYISSNLKRLAVTRSSSMRPLCTCTCRKAPRPKTARVPG
jgi:ATP-dependent Lon protease